MTNTELIAGDEIGIKVIIILILIKLHQDVLKLIQILDDFFKELFLKYASIIVWDIPFNYIIVFLF